MNEAVALVAHSGREQQRDRLVDEMAEERAAPGRAQRRGHERIGLLSTRAKRASITATSAPTAANES